MQLTERLIQNRLWQAWGRVTGTLLVPNYTPADWYECDLFYVTAAGYMREYEIKITVADFRKDAAKGTSHNGRWKHHRLGLGDPQGPHQFWYVVPEGLIVAADVPAHAGLFYIDPAKYRPIMIKRAPHLHQKGVGEEVLTHARGVCYYRMWNERMRNHR